MDAAPGTAMPGAAAWSTPVSAMGRLDHRVALSRHPDSPAAGLESVDVRLSPVGAGGLALTYRLHGDSRRLRLPAPAAAGPADGLWQHTCCEFFVAEPGAAAYREFNFSPSGQWAAYSFRDYREREEGSAVSIAPAIVVRRFDAGVELAATLPRAALPAAHRLACGLAVVVEDSDGSLSYWALRHPAGRPDFHRRDGFALLLELPEPPA